jgi:excisionase family DNA binding protein
MRTDCYDSYIMGQARPDLIKPYWENPPGPRTGLYLHRTINGREYQARVRWNESLTQIEAAAVLEVTLMTVNRWVRGGKLKDHNVRGKSMIRLAEIKRILEERHPRRGRRIYLTG